MLEFWQWGCCKLSCLYTTHPIVITSLELGAGLHKIVTLTPEIHNLVCVAEINNNIIVWSRWERIIKDVGDYWLHFRIFHSNDGNWAATALSMFSLCVDDKYICDIQQIERHRVASRGLMLFWWHQSIRQMPLINVRCQNTHWESDDMIPWPKFSKIIQIFDFREQISPDRQQACGELLPGSSFSPFCIWSMIDLEPETPVSTTRLSVYQAETDLFSIRTFDGYKPEQ